MNYTNEFTEIVELCQPTYIGLGNPSSKILILGKECAIDAEQQQAHYKREIIDNAFMWQGSVNANTTPAEVEDFFSSNELNPLYPYKGQQFLKSPNGGTCSTWYYYQKLYNLIAQKDPNDNIDFFEHCFISELSDATARYSALVDNENRIKSIERRKKLFKSDFFQNFPIVIVAAGHYCRDYNIDLEDIFGVKWIGHTIDIGGKWINIHYNVDGLSPKLLIHTNQLSMISNELLARIAEVCSEFIDKNNISL